MRDYLGTDIKLADFNISVADGDIELVSGVDCVKQDLSDAIQTPLFFWGMEMDFGSRLAEFVQGGNDPFYIPDLRRAVNEVFEKEIRVERDSWKIDIYKVSSGVQIEAEFLPIEHETPESLSVIITDRG